MMEVAPNQVFEKLQLRAQRDPLVAEILRTAALEAAVDQLSLQVAESSETEPSQPDEG